MRLSLALAVLVGLLSSGCYFTSKAATGAGRQNLAHQCVPDFSAAGDWVVADGGRSVVLPNGSNIHLFGDTLLQSADAENAGDYTMVGNTVGIGRCAGGAYRIDYYYREDSGGRHAIFELPNPKLRLWPVDGYFFGGRLHVVLGKIRAVSTGLGFEQEGTVIATVHNPFDPPSRWTISYEPLTEAKTPYQPNLGITLWGDFAYLFGSLVTNEGPNPVVLLRLPAAVPSNPRAHLQYLSRRGSFEPVARFTPEDAWIVLKASPTTMYVHWHPGLQRWLTLYADPAFGSPNMMLSTAARLEGPWSSPRVVYRFPEMTAPEYRNRGLVCYAVAEHPQLRRAGGRVLVATYACNTLGGPFPPLEDLHLYRPKAVLIDLAAPDPEPAAR